MSGGLPSAPLGRERAGRDGRQIMTVGDPGEVVPWTRLTARFALRSETPIAAFLGSALAAIHCVCQGRARRWIRQRRKRRKGMDRIGCQRRQPLSERLRGSRRVRAGRARLGPRPRWRILHACAPFETARVEAALDAPAALAQAVRDAEAA